MKYNYRIALLASCLALAGLLGLGFVLPQSAIAGLSPAGLTSDRQAGAPIVTEVKKWKNKDFKYKGPNVNIKKKKGNIYIGPKHGGRVYVRGWNRRPYYGTVIAGVALGTIIAAAAAPPPPADNLCWYWTNPSKNKGYWDYCY